jgi:hypothetical protein
MNADVAKPSYLKWSEVPITFDRKDHPDNVLSYGPSWAHYLGGYQDRLLGGPLGLPGLCHTAPDSVRRKDYGGEVLG